MTETKSTRKRNVIIGFIAANYRLCFILLFSAVFICNKLYARAGGGHGYSTPSGGSSGSGGGGGGDDIISGLVFRLLLELIIRYPVVGIPLTVGVIYVAYKIPREGREIYVDRTIRRGLPVQQKLRKAQAATAILSRDSKFNEQNFLARVKTAFHAIQNAWSDLDLSKVQGFLSDGVYERFSLQIKEMQDAGIKDHMEKIHVQNCSVAQIQSDSNFDTIHVAITASAVNYRVDARSGKKIEGSTNPQSFEEVWSFIRRPGAETLAKPGLIEGFCPNCSAPVSIARVAICEVCNSFLRSGEYDWVLSEITQAPEWSVNEISSIPGLKTIVAADPGFNVQHIEDRASVVFWRNATAERIGRVDPIRKFASDDYCNELEKRLKAADSLTRHFFGDCAVGSVDLKAVELANPFDRAFVEIRWCGKPMMLEKNAKPVAETKTAMFMRNQYVFIRKSGVKTSLKPSLSSAHCAACGAPEKNGLENVCEYCGTVQNDGSLDWVLEKIVSTTDQQVVDAIKRVTSVEAAGSHNIASKGDSATDCVSPIPDGIASASFRSNISGGEMLRWMTAMMLADGIVDSKETAMLRDFAKKFGVPEAFVNETVREMQSGKISVTTMELPKSRDEVREILKAMAGMALIDGRLSDEETSILNSIGSKVGIEAYDIRLMVRQERSRLYEEAKRALREFKNFSTPT